MAVDDFMETEVAAAAAVTAAAFSPRVRKLLRRGMVYGVAGAMEVGEAVRTAASGVSDAIQDRRTGRSDGDATADGQATAATGEEGVTSTQPAASRTSPSPGGATSRSTGTTSVAGDEI